MLDDASRPTQLEEFGSGLKYDRSGPVPIILVPQPSDDPNDPLVSVLKVYAGPDSLKYSRIGHYGSVIVCSLSSLLYL